MTYRGADISVHETLHPAHQTAESRATLRAEYQTIAAIAGTKRWDDLISNSGLTALKRDRIRVGPARGALHAALRYAEASGLDLDKVF